MGLRFPQTRDVAFPLGLVPDTAGHGCWPKPSYSEDGQRDLHVRFGDLARVPQEAHETIAIADKKPIRSGLTAVGAGHGHGCRSKLLTTPLG